MTKSKTKEPLCFFPLFHRFIQESKSGRRLQPGGKRLSPGTIRNYENALRLLNDFVARKGFSMRIYKERYLNQRDTQREKNHWKKFYAYYSDYLYKDCGYFDNYTGQQMKILKTFFNYLNNELALGVGQFHKQFYVQKEEKPIFPLAPEELNYLIYNKSFEASLTKRMQEVKDVFVFGCTVALRVSDLLDLKRSNLRTFNGQYYLLVRSRKTAVDSQIKLPGYAVELLGKYMRLKGGKILPHFNRSNLNQYIKVLLEQAGFVQEVNCTRERRGRAVCVKSRGGGKKLRFCDVASTHTMRRTAITTMLSLGVPEGMVRKISGHAPGTKEFYRYVSWAQTYQDKMTEQAFSSLSDLKLN